MKIHNQAVSQNIIPIWFYLTLLILMDNSMHIETLIMELPILYFKGLQVEISKL